MLAFEAVGIRAKETEMAKNSFFRTSKIEWSNDPRRQNEIIENLSRRLQEAECLLAANAVIIKALIKKTGIHMGDVAGAGNVKEYVGKDQPQMDNISVASVRLNELMGKE